MHFAKHMSNFFFSLAELALRQEEKKPGFSLQLLQITASATYPYTTRLASSLCFKNFIKRNWTDEDGNYKLQADEVATIKRELISLMISVPAGIQSQLGEAVSVIADSDFWERWDTLVDVSHGRRIFVAGLSIDFCRILFPGSNRPTPLSTTASSKSRTQSSRDGDHCSGRMSCTVKSITFSRDSAVPSWLCSRYIYSGMPYRLFKTIKLRYSCADWF